MHHMITGAHGGQKTVSDPLEELELQAVVDCPMWELAIEPESSPSTASVPTTGLSLGSSTNNF